MNELPFRMSRRKFAAELMIMAFATLVLALLGPFGTWELSLGKRLLFWMVFAAGGYGCFRPVIAGGDALASQSTLPRWAAIAIAILIASFPTTLIVALTFAGANWRKVSAGDLAGLYPMVLIIGSTITVIQLLLPRREPTVQPAAAVSPVIAPRSEIVSVPERAADAISFLDQLPPHLGRQLLCIENEDHYVRVHTSAGSALILMRLRDAVTQLCGVEGMQVHRGWWVARAAVAVVVRQERRIVLRLIDGREVPVSRTSAPMLREQGWL